MDVSAECVVESAFKEFRKEHSQGEGYILGYVSRGSDEGR